MKRSRECHILSQMAMFLCGHRETTRAYIYHNSGKVFSDHRLHKPVMFDFSFFFFFFFFFFNQLHFKRLIRRLSLSFPSSSLRVISQAHLKKKIINLSK